jgi:tartrate-resistant acid phosphatase type 5
MLPHSISKQRLYLRATAGILLLSAQAFAQQAPTLEDQLLLHLPPDWRPVALRYHVFTDSFKALLKIPDPTDLDDAVHSETMERLIDETGAEEFVVAHLDEIIATARSEGDEKAAQEAKFLTGFLYQVAEGDNWLNSPLTVPFLEHEAAIEPDPDISLAAVKALHILEARRAQATVDRRLLLLSAGDYKTNKDQIDQLEAEQQDLFYIRDQIDLPKFMRDAPPVFQAPSTGAKPDSIRVVMMGDFGTRGEDQHKVAKAMVDEHRKKPFDFGITLGDNFYVNLAGTDDPNWRLAFEDLYGPMNITFYPCFGNHDWGGEYPAIELAYSRKNPHWSFPAPYYTYTAGPVQFFVLNIQFEGSWPSVSALQLRWLKTQLEESKAKWKVVYGHTPIYTTDYSVPDLISGLMPVLKGRADVYISGHVHNLEQHKPVDGVNLFVIGSSGRGEVPVHDDPGTIFAKEAYGFGVLEANDRDLTIRILGEDDKEMHSATFHK